MPVPTARGSAFAAVCDMGALPRILALACGCLFLANCSLADRFDGASLSAVTPAAATDATAQATPENTDTAASADKRMATAKAGIDPEGYSAKGLASWYGPAFHGRMTSDGEIFDRNALTAAHPSLPLPCYARVTNLNNGRSVIVRVNDRGPFHKGRILDVSEKTADMLGFRHAGTGRIKVDYVGPASLAGSDERRLMASYRDDGKPAQMPHSVMLASLSAPPPVIIPKAADPMLRLAVNDDDDAPAPPAKAALEKAAPAKAAMPKQAPDSAVAATASPAPAVKTAEAAPAQENRSVADRISASFAAAGGNMTPPSSNPITTAAETRMVAPSLNAMALSGW